MIRHRDIGKNLALTPERHHAKCPDFVAGAHTFVLIKLRFFACIDFVQRCEQIVVGVGGEVGVTFTGAVPAAFVKPQRVLRYRSDLHEARRGRTLAQA